MIRLKCPGCGKVLKAADSAAGKVAKCKQCDTRLKIPIPRPPDPVVSASHSSAALSAEASRPMPALNSPGSEPPSFDAPGFGDNLFGDLPEFSAPPGVAAKPLASTNASPTIDASDDLFADAALGAAMPDQLSVQLPSPSSDPLAGADAPDQFAAALEQAVDLASRDHKSQLQKNAIAASAKLSASQIAQVFGKPIDPIATSQEYSQSLNKVATTMIAMPVAFIATVVIGTIIMAWSILNWWGSEPTGNMLNPFIALIVAAIVALLLAAWVPVMNMFFAGLSLLTSGPQDRPGTRQLSRDEQPVLYEFVDQICKKLDAPAPTRIDLDCEYNASASFDQGWLSFNKKEYVLTLGVPLIASQSTEQLASVIAHEFGHFCQSGGMRAHYLIRHLNGWFINSAINKTIRDEVNDYIAANSDLGGFGMIWTIYYWIGWVGRQMMFFFGRVGHAFSGSLSREMEYDADKYAVHLAGSKHFADSMTLVSTHGVAYAVTIDNLKDMFQHGILVNNIPRFMMYIAKTMPASAVRRIAEQSETQKQERFDTHPPTRDRIAAATALGKPGILQIGRPAIDLVNHWTKLCENITLDFYSGVTGEKITSDDVSKLEDVLAAEHKLLLDKTV